MGARHPLPYAYAKAHTLLLEDDGGRLVLWAPESVGLPALSEVLRLYEVDALEREGAASLANRIAVAYAGSGRSTPQAIGIRTKGRPSESSTVFSGISIWDYRNSPRNNAIV